MKPYLRYLVLSIAVFSSACSGGKQAAEPESQKTAQPPETVDSSESVVVRGTTWEMDDPLPFDRSIVVDTLDNGLVIYVAHNPKPEDRAELRLAVNTGSVLEDDDQLGLAHFVEHMAFNGTENFEKQQIINYLERHGMSFGADLNAYTSFDETVYMLQVPTDSIDVLHTGIKILRDWASRLTFEDEEVDKERGVVIEEWRSGRGASARMFDKQFPILLRGSKYAKRLPIGKPDVIENADYETIKRFYRDWYRSDLMAVVAVGDFDVDEVLDYIRATFSDLEAPSKPRERNTYDVPYHTETLVAPATDPEAPYGIVGIVYKRDKEPKGTVGAYRRAIVSGLYHGMFNNRLSELTQDTDPPFAFAGSGPGSFVREAEFYNLSALVREGGAERALETLLVEAERVRLHGFTESELAREKESMLRYYERSYAERDKSESNRFAGEYIRNFLVGESVPGIEFEYPLVEALLPAIKVDEVNARSQKLITKENRVVTLSGPDKPEYALPDSATVIGKFAIAAAANPAPYVDRTLDEPLLPDLPEAGSIVDETTIDTLGMTWLILSNGVRVILKPTDFKNDEILMRAYSPGGTSIYPDSLYIAASTSSSLIGQSGIGNFGPIELGKALSGKVVSVSASVGELAENLGGSASLKDLETMFQLIYLNFVAPRADEIAFESYKVRMREILETAKASPERAFSDTVTVTMAQYHYRARPADDAMLDEMDLDASLVIFQDRFADAGDFTFYFVGAFTNDEIKPLITRYLASLPSTGREESWKDVGKRPPKGVIEKTVVRGIEPKSRVLLVFTGPFSFDRESRIRFQTFADIMRIKFREVLREDMGGTYGVRIGAATSKIPYEGYRLTIGFGTDPDRVDELVDRVMIQIDSLQTFGIDESYLEKVREIRRRSHEKNLKRNRYWLSSIAFVDRYNEDPMTILEGHGEFMGRLDSNMMREAANRYFNLENYAKFVLLAMSE
ncbi:MAG: M16 family metallopeptidase [Rhodothermia bacterium]